VAGGHEADKFLPGADQHARIAFLFLADGRKRETVVVRGKNLDRVA
jgi:hypothetical protein